MPKKRKPIFFCFFPDNLGRFALFNQSSAGFSPLNTEISVPQPEKDSLAFLPPSMPNFFIRLWRVDGFKPKMAAAPCLP